MNLGNSASKTAAYVLAFIVTFVAVKYGKEFLFEQQAIAESDERIEKLREDGSKKHPELTASEAAGVEPIERITESLGFETDRNKKMQTAAYSFLGFYFVNASERSAFCSELGISITPYTVAVERLHTRELAVARELTSDTRAQEAKFLAMLKPQMRKTVVQDMTDLSSSFNVPVSEVCHFLSKNGEAFAQEMHISKMMPAVYNALMGGQ